MRTLPTTHYSGLTFIIDEPSRFDKDNNRLLSGPARDFLINECLPAHYPLDACDIRTCDCPDRLLDGTKALILSGERACQTHGRVSCDPCGFVTIAHNHLALPLFYIQDALDFRMMRGGNTDYDEDVVTDRDTKETMVTRRKSYRFWIKWHINKFLTNAAPQQPKINIRAYPRIDEVCAALDAISNEDLYLDIETSQQHRCLSCIGFSSTSLFPTVFVVPVYLISGNLAYRDFHRFYRSFSLALSRNKAVIHNAMFDLCVLHGFYKMCWPESVYDTMAATHRCFLEAEKSLAHTIAAWTNLPNHKNFDTEIYNDNQQQNLWTYNAHDVYALKLIKGAQLAYAKNDPGLLASIEQVNDSIIPYLDTSLTGLRLDSMSLSTAQIELLKHKRLYERIASILVGSPFNPGSPTQCSNYFNKVLHYESVGKTDSGKEAMGSKALYQLQLKYNNPLIPTILKYREVAKDASSLESELFTLP